MSGPLILTSSPLARLIETAEDFKPEFHEDKLRTTYSEKNPRMTQLSTGTSSFTQFLSENPLLPQVNPTRTMFDKLFRRNHNKPSVMSEGLETTTTNEEIYILKKRHPGCTGMFWRSDPTGATKCTQTSEHWPRDHALLRGTPITINNNNNQNEQWLLASAVQQHNTSTWTPAPVGAALPFEYDNHYYLEKVE